MAKKKFRHPDLYWRDLALKEVEKRKKRKEALKKLREQIRKPKLQEVH